LFCAWLSWSRFGVVVPAWDQQLPTLIACLDTTLRRIVRRYRTVRLAFRGNGGAPGTEDRGRIRLSVDAPSFAGR
jgi:hypothetical protein